MKKKIIMTTSTGEKIVCRKSKGYKLNIKNIAIFSTSIVMAASGIAYALVNKKDDEVKNKEKFEIITESDIDLENNISEDIAEKENNSNNSEEEKEFIELSYLQETFGINYETIKELINEYASYANYNYEDALDLVFNKREEIKNEYLHDSKEGIIDTIIAQAEEEGKISYHCNDWEVTTRYRMFENSFEDPEEMRMKLEQRDEIEPKLINMCNILNMSEEETYLSLAIFRWEADHGASEKSVYHNNYGGIVYDGEFAVFSNPDYGMYKTLHTIKEVFIENAKAAGCQDIQSIIEYIAPTYCTHTPYEWLESISSMYENVKYEYTTDEKHLVR